MLHKVSITGTKGKTTVTNFVAEVLLKSKRFDNVLHVNTTGHFMNGVRKSTLEDGTQTWGLVPTVSPGKYLYEFLPERIKTKKNIAVLESSLGSSTLSGLGYGMHTVGVFLNVFEDHIGSSTRLKNKNDIFKAKSFVVTKLAKDAWLALNADDSYVMKSCTLLNPEKRINVILFGLHIDLELLKRHDIAGYVTCESEWLVYVDVKKGKKKKIIKYADVEWTMDGLFIPSVYNLMAIVATLICVQKGSVMPHLSRYLQELKMPETGGRLTKFVNKKGVTIIADYAHEKVSLKEVGILAKKMTSEGGKTIGVVRLAYDRTEELIRDTAKHIAPYYDSFVVYDKIDGFWKKAKPIQSTIFTQENGKISDIFAKALKEKHIAVERILREDHAIKKAAFEARPGDVVVVIVNDNIERSISFIKKYFAV